MINNAFSFIFPLIFLAIGVIIAITGGLGGIYGEIFFIIGFIWLQKKLMPKTRSILFWSGLVISNIFIFIYLFIWLLGLGERFEYGLKLEHYFYLLSLVFFPVVSIIISYFKKNLGAILLLISFLSWTIYRLIIMRGEISSVLFYIIPFIISAPLIYLSEKGRPKM